MFTYEINSASANPGTNPSRNLVSSTSALHKQPRIGRVVGPWNYKR